MKKEAAKLRRVKDQDMSIMDMKKSFRYLQQDSVNRMVKSLCQLRGVA